MFGLIKKWRRRRVLRQPFPGNWAAILDRTFPLYRRVPENLRSKLQRTIQVFIAEKHFEGCGGLELTDEIKVTIAAHACLLILGNDNDLYPELSAILVYPSTYKVNVSKVDGIFKEESESVRLGESWTRGNVILSWDAVQHGAYDANDGHNVAFHEFAHQLDQEDGSGNGAPLLTKRTTYTSWARILGSEFNAMRQKLAGGEDHFLNPYAATNPAEFFAVASEAFFEQSQQFKSLHPELYQQLENYYGQDPITYHNASPS